MPANLAARAVELYLLFATLAIMAVTGLIVLVTTLTGQKPHC